MSQFKIPPFLSEHFNSLTAEEKQETVERYKAWYNNQFTELFTDWLESQYEDLLDKDESKSDFATWFSFAYKTVRNKAQRNLLRGILAKMDYKV